MDTSGKKNGQAMIELCVALVSILVVCAGLLQLTSITRLQTEALSAAREESAKHMFLDLSPPDDPAYIRFWQTGPDGKPMTADDSSTSANASQFADIIVARAVRDPADWSFIVQSPNDSLFALRDIGTPSRAFGLIGATERRTIELLPVIQHLVYAAQSVTIEENVWLTWTRGIY